MDVNVQRPEHFRRCYAKAYDDVKKQVFYIGPGAEYGTWDGRGNRKRARALARKMAREQMKAERQTHHGQGFGIKVRSSISAEE